MRGQIETIISLILFLIALLYIQNIHFQIFNKFLTVIHSIYLEVQKQWEFLKYILDPNPACYYPFLFTTEYNYSICKYNYTCFIYNGTHFIIKNGNAILSIISEDYIPDSHAIMFFPNRTLYVKEYFFYTGPIKIRNGLIIIDELITNYSFFEINGTPFPLCKIKPNLLYYYKGTFLLIPSTEA